VETSILAAIEHPLTALMTSAQLLEKDFGALSPQQVRGRIAAMHRGAFWLHALVENMLCAAAARDGRLDLRRQTLWLEDLLRNVAAAVAAMLDEQGQRLETSLEQPTSAVPADPRRISQVLVNLISNASEHSAAGAPIELSAFWKGAVVRVSVGDRGPALPEEHEGRPFESLWRPGPAPDASDENATLGLVVSRWIVEAHGGTVGASNRPGGGARFWFELPTN